MKPITFKEANCNLAEHQPEYQTLPVFRAQGGEIVSCWKLTLIERLKVLFTGKFWFCVLTFNQPLQPQLPLAYKPKWMKEALDEQEKTS